MGKLGNMDIHHAPPRAPAEILDLPSCSLAHVMLSFKMELVFVPALART